MPFHTHSRIIIHEKKNIACLKVCEYFFFQTHDWQKNTLVRPKNVVNRKWRARFYAYLYSFCIKQNAAHEHDVYETFCCYTHYVLHAMHELTYIFSMMRMSRLWIENKNAISHSHLTLSTSLRCLRCSHSLRFLLFVCYCVKTLFTK